MRRNRFGRMEHQRFQTTERGCVLGRVELSRFHPVAEGVQSTSLMALRRHLEHVMFQVEVPWCS